MLAAAISGFLANFWRSIFSAALRFRLNSQQTNPKANMFLQRSMALLSRPESFRLSLHIEDMGTSRTSCLIPNSSNALFVVNFAFSKSFAPKESESVMTSPCGLQNLICVFRAAGFIATNTLQRSPGVNILFAPICT